MDQQFLWKSNSPEDTYPAPAHDALLRERYDNSQLRLDTGSIKHGLSSDARSHSGIDKRISSMDHLDIADSLSTHQDIGQDDENEENVQSRPDDESGADEESGADVQSGSNIQNIQNRPNIQNIQNGPNNVAPQNIVHFSDGVSSNVANSAVANVANAAISNAAISNAAISNAAISNPVNTSISNAAISNPVNASISNAAISNPVNASIPNAANAAIPNAANASIPNPANASIPNSANAIAPIATKSVSNPPEGTRRVVSTKRAAQNRNSQNAFRKRRQKYIEELEATAEKVKGMQKTIDDLRSENMVLRDFAAALRARLIEIEESNETSRSESDIVTQ